METSDRPVPAIAGHEGGFQCLHISSVESTDERIHRIHGARERGLLRAPY
jgi:hypothetical protein